MTAPEEFALYAVPYATRPGRRGDHFLGFDDRSAEPHPTAYYVWVAVSATRAVVVDAGIDPDHGHRPAGLELACSPVDGVRALGVDPGAVDHVVLTHLHYDHTGTAARFPHARYVVQRAEADYWRGPVAARLTREHWLVDPDDLAHVLGAGDRLDLVDGDDDVVPGLSVHHVGGHTAGMQVVSVRTARGRAVVASDAVHFLENLTDDRPPPLLHSVPDVHLAFDRVRALADAPDLVLPGHDPAVAERTVPVPGTPALRLA